MSSESSEREQSPSPAKSPRSSPLSPEEPRPPPPLSQVPPRVRLPATIARPPHTGAPPPPLHPLRPVMTPWLGDASSSSFGAGASWQHQLNTFQPWVSPSAEADKHQGAAPGFSTFPPPPGHPGSLSAFQRPGHTSHGHRESLGGHRPGQAGFDRPLGVPLRPPTQIFRAPPEPGEVTIEKVEQPWAALVTSSAATSEPAGPSRAPPPVTATSASFR